jgi:hypothetical protein
MDISRCARELGIDIATIIDVLSKIQRKRSIIDPEASKASKSLSLEKEIDLDFEKLKKMEESDTLEFKASMLTPMVSKKTISNSKSNIGNERDQQKLGLMIKGMRETLKNEIVTTICAFMNSAGGILLVGVQDDGSVSGLEQDFKASGGSTNWDSWLQVLANLIRDKIGTEFVKYVKVERVYMMIR